jgi:hypothetical protein
MARKIPTMKESLAKGEAGEQLLMSVYPHGLLHYRHREFDFIRDDFKSIELKSDGKASTATGNFFFERWTVSKSRKPGSIWISAEHKVDIFLYFFIGDRILYECEDIPRLVHRVEAAVRNAQMPLKVIQNYGWHGEGWAVPIADVADLFKRYDCSSDKCIPATANVPNLPVSTVPKEASKK